MFKKINNVFRPNQHGPGVRDAGGVRSEQDYHSACTVRLVRSTSMLVVGEKTQVVSSTLKRSKSTVSIESTLYYYQRQEDRIWLYSQNQNCLEYLEALVALRRQYTKSVSDFKSKDSKATVSSKKKHAPPPPTKEGTVSFNHPKQSTWQAISKTNVLPVFCFFSPQISRAKPSAPPVPNVEDSLQFFDAVIAGCDSEPLRKSYMDDGHADVDFIVASSSAEHDLHSNWVLRVPRVADDSKQKEVHVCAKESVSKKKNKSGSTSSRLRLQRNPIHLPKVVESAFQTLRFKPKLKKQ
ncbi:uncharacterized protein C13orf42 isoform X1 [Gymnodraco acuticeps]|uniref:Uncharacterized protein C13orf42 isoform X1 n=1 Tax=Gymnodraco acuticeps TaxID=8218 RepID=A0A6P8UW30_GYMAC|nr:uncharacterized protein C13orf42 isoform X1 [Gymnodraco acuticeps]XP_034069572.1 uncharacterized protein C13orf42 isoform X1 [Gymnodraco acuticeps]XP_034069573.1 uncharacterized protein C13orf42 isoform X1 [Gymnodraco acuticeps]